MSNPSKDAKKIPAVRTYAMDLEIGRQEKGLPPEEKEKVAEPVKKVATTIISAPKKSFEKNPIPSTPIPAFKNKAKEEKKPVIKNGPRITDHGTKNTTFIVDNEDAAEATVITDLKHKRFKFFPAVIASLKQWFEDKKSSYADKKHPKYSVPETSRRKGVIQKATSASGKLTTADFSSIQERIRQRNESLKEKEDGPSTIWTANTEPGYPLLKGESASQVTNVSVVPRKSFQTKPEPVIEVKKEEPIIATPVVEPEPVIEFEELQPEPVTEPEQEVEEMTEPIIEEPEVSRRVVSTEVNKKSSVPARLKFLMINTNLLTVGISGIVIVVIIVVAIGYFRLNPSSNNSQIFFSQPVVEIIKAPYIEVATTFGEVDSYTKALATSRERKDEVTQIILTDESGKHLSTQNILNGLQIPPDQNFKQSITEVRLGFLKDSSPFLLLEAKDKMITLGGLLSWETTIHRDFNRTFSLQSFIEGGKFIDGTLGGHDVRVLKNEAGSEVLIYGLVGHVTIITTDSNHFSELSNLIK